MKRVCIHNFFHELIIPLINKLLVQVKILSLHKSSESPEDVLRVYAWYSKLSTLWQKRNINSVHLVYAPIKKTDLHSDCKDVKNRGGVGAKSQKHKSLKKLATTRKYQNKLADIVLAGNKSSNWMQCAHDNQ